LLRSILPIMLQEFWVGGQVCDALRGCTLRSELTSVMLLPHGSETKVEAGFLGVLGAFELYRGSVRGHRMANLRVILR
jgi:hypothetical protein